LKKYQIIILAVFLPLIALYAIGRLSGGLVVMSMPTSSNEPTIHLGDHFFVSNWKTPKRFDLICYRRDDPVFKKQIWLHRLCGMPGDIVEIRNDTLFVNGKNADANLNVRKYFVLPVTALQDQDINEEDITPTEKGDSAIVILETIKQKDLINKGRPHMMEYAGSDSTILRTYGRDWTLDNFGPFKVPYSSYFVLGDNRNFAMDSRFIGPIKIEDYFATALK